MNQNRTSHEKVRRLVVLALLTAMVVVLQLLGSFITIGTTPISLTLVPIVLGAVLLGPGAGAILGAAFGIVALGAGFSGKDMFTSMLLSVAPFWTIVVCMAKGMLAGAVAGWIAKLLKKNLTLGCILAALSAPIVNTGVFALGMLTVIRPGLDAFVNSIGGGNAVEILFLVLIGVNFLIEMVVNAVLSAAISRVAKAVTKENL